MTKDQYREYLRVSERAERASLEIFRIHKYSEVFHSDERGEKNE